MTLTDVKFCDWGLNCNDLKNYFAKNIFSNEALFYLNGAVNLQTWRYWRDTSPHWMEYVNCQNSTRLVIWAALWKNTYCPFSFEDKVTTDTFIALLNNQF